jgi:WD40 repeat protein
VWDLEDRTPVPDIRGHTSMISEIGFADDAAFSRDMTSTVACWDTQKGSLRGVLRFDGSKVEPSLDRVALSPKANLEFSFKQPSKIAVRDLKTGQWVREVSLPEGLEVGRLCACRDGQHLLISHRNTLTLWDLQSGAIKSSLLPDHANLLSLTDDCRYAFIGSVQGKVILWDIEDARSVYTINAHPSTQLAAVAIDGHGRYGASSSFNQDLRVWDLENGTCVYELQVDRRVTAIALDENKLLFGDLSGGVYFLDAPR